MKGDEPLADANEAATTLLKLYEALGVIALVISVEDGAIVVRCQDAGDVPELVQRVVDAYRPAEGRTIN